VPNVTYKNYEDNNRKCVHTATKTRLILCLCHSGAVKQKTASATVQQIYGYSQASLKCYKTEKSLTHANHKR